uniref:ribosome small subunit-dependent GTPase A n=1 Tax=Candidatus Fimivicinus sp. TaxID=3056640 RepID=UPI003FF0E737
MIHRGIGGFYYVEAADAVYECKARGIFRKRKQTPLVGDSVRITVGEASQENTIDEILPRKNMLRRPPLANLDQLVIVASTCEPAPNLLLLDKLTAIAVSKQIVPILVFSKTDLCKADELTAIYHHAGMQALSVSCKTGEGVAQLKALLPGKLSAFTGNSGVGKSSLLNCLDASLQLPTGEISDKLGRGRHTTRQSEIFHLAGGLVADTPGFSSLDLEKSEVIRKDKLPFCFPEFLPYLGRCRFSSCTHTKDKGCAVLRAVADGEIEQRRHESYVSLYEAVKDLKEWEID